MGEVALCGPCGAHGEGRKARTPARRSCPLSSSLRAARHRQLPRQRSSPSPRRPTPQRPAMPSWPTALGGMLAASYAATQAQKIGIDASPSVLVQSALKGLTGDSSTLSSMRPSGSAEVGSGGRQRRSAGAEGRTKRHKAPHQRDYRFPRSCPCYKARLTAYTSCCPMSCVDRGEAALATPSFTQVGRQLQHADGPAGSCRSASPGQARATPRYLLTQRLPAVCLQGGAAGLSSSCPPQ
jgi:hypothetical protein